MISAMYHEAVSACLCNLITGQLYVMTISIHQSMGNFNNIPKKKKKDLEPASISRVFHGS
jgi:hypothetical protein